MTKAKDLLKYFLVFLLGIMLSFTYLEQKQNKSNALWYKEKINSYMPYEYKKVKQRNRNLQSKWQG